MKDCINFSSWGFNNWSKTYLIYEFLHTTASMLVDSMGNELYPYLATILENSKSVHSLGRFFD